MNSLDKFKDDYPEVFEKFLEMNRALAKIQRSIMRNEPRVSDDKRLDLGDDTAMFLELD